MIDWWQALILLGVGSLLTLGAGYVQRWWGISDAREAEERESTRRAKEEERQARRQRRRERMKPILEFLDIARQFVAQDISSKWVDRAWERNHQGVKQQMTLEQFRKAISDRSPSFAANADPFELLRSSTVALSAAPTVEMATQLGKVWDAIGDAHRSETQTEVSSAIRRAEQLVEDNLAEV